MSYAVLSFVKCSEKAHIVKTTRTRSAQLQRRVRHHRSSTDRYQHRPKTVHAFLEVSYSVPNFVKSNEKSHIGLTPRLDQRDYCSGFDTTGAAPVVASMGPTSRTCYVLSDVSLDQRDCWSVFDGNEVTTPTPIDVGMASSTAHVLHDESYAVPTFLKSGKSMA
ncbi:hypothetical protein PF001_g23013 [Phytophthora fragariae]|uniref:Uncharacterized protein n=1 Tax=Phytophthora fragariae TaxID=53985 RepID=A0A6A4C2Y2_9STRA|nr:hypothetical protein PF006_g23132 [Phytophthora fragariae]KAE9283064.1 hypothetical protein PF001_g23013 [Phytophthora fragariae]